MSALAAIFLFNHRFEKNVAKLETMYAGRFSRRRYIMPFSRSGAERVIPIYETSWNFSGHIAQAGPSLPRDDVSHYVFVADDLILHPDLNEVNLLASLGVGEGEAYIKSLASVDTNRYRWYRGLLESMRFDEQNTGFDHLAELPPAADAKQRFEALGVTFPFPRPQTARDARLTVHRFRPLVGSANYLRWAGRRTSYPLLYGYSDFVIVPAAGMPDFLHYCGIFAALNVFAEVAVPTALALSVDRIRTELAIGEHFEEPAKRSSGAAMRGVELWGQPRIEAFEQETGRDLSRLAASFPPNRLYIHPVKLSRFS